MPARDRTLQLLGLTPSATSDEIKLRYRELARIFHPDANPSDDRANARFRAIAAAYRSLMADEEVILLTDRNRRPSSEKTPPDVTDAASTVRVVRVDVRLADVISGACVAFTTTTGIAAHIDVPSGADTGTLVRHASSDTLVEIRVVPDPRFRRQGADLLTTLSLSIDDAHHGKCVELATPSGQVRVLVPVRSRHGDVVRIVGRGVPSPMGRGDLFVELVV